eukprot:m.164118 g.164118  ORF g.164118 m.164118 type:complete len:287 (+) comp13422_c0_seq1:47-907(+)
MLSVGGCLRFIATRRRVTGLGVVSACHQGLRSMNTTVKCVNSFWSGLRQLAGARGYHVSTTTFSKGFLPLKKTWNGCGVLIPRNLMSSSTSGANTQASGFVAWYSKMLLERPLTTKAISAGIIGLTGDFLAQKLEGNPFNYTRLLQFTAVQTIFLTPILHVWYMTLARFVTGSGTGMMLKKLLLDQFVFTPILLPVYMAVLLTVENRMNEIFNEITNNVPSTLVKCWQLWIPAQCVNFWIVPVHYQVLFSNCVGLVWSIYLSFIAHQSHDDSEDNNVIVVEDTTTS